MLFEDQALSFDDRAGLPPGASEAVARAFADMVGLDEGKTLLEIGPGTGQLSLPLLQWPIRYIGVDRSSAMIDVFRSKVEAAGLKADLIVADGNERWPVEDASVDIVFSSRSLHLLEPYHVVAEIRRVLKSAGGWLVVGRMRRSHDSIKAVLRRRMRWLLEERGYRGRGRRSEAEDIFAVLECDGGRRFPRLDAARWLVSRRPSEALAEWEGKEGLDGLAVPDEVKDDVMAELRSYAEQEYGDLERPLKEWDTFALIAIDLRVI